MTQSAQYKIAIVSDTHGNWQQAVREIQQAQGVTHLVFLGDYAKDGGDYIRLLDWLEETGRNYPIRIHNMNPIGAENMRRIIRKNGWKEVL